MGIGNCTSNNHGMNLFVFTVMMCLVLILINVSQIQDTIDNFYKQFRKFVRTENFPDSSSCTQIGSSCYSCSEDKYTFDPTTMLCYDPVTKNSYSPISIVKNTDTPITVPQTTTLPTGLVPSNYTSNSNINYTYTCSNDKYTFDLSTNLCYDPLTKNSYEPIINSEYSTSDLPLIPLPANSKNYQCTNEDTLIGNTCYACHRGGTYNASVNMCEMVTESYLPTKMYTPTSDTRNCENGYVYDYGKCVQCNPYDKYVSGHRCTKIKGSPSIGSYLATNINKINKSHATTIK